MYKSIACILLVTTAHCVGQQTAFYSKPVGDKIECTYKWKNEFGNHTTTVLIAQTVASTGFYEFTQLNNSEIDNKTALAIQAEAPNVSKLFGVEVEIKVEDNWYSFTVKGGTNKVVMEISKWLEKKAKEIRDEKLREAYFIRSKANNNSLDIDYARLINRYVHTMYDVAKALHIKAGGKRAAITHYLNFIQSIPYSNKFHNDAGFTTPIGMLLENKGDCDTKAVAFAALMKNFGLPVILFIIPEHVMIGVELTPSTSDVHMKIGDKKYILAETGQGYPLGAISSDTMEELKRGNYQIIVP